MQFILLSCAYRTAVTQQHTQNSDVTACCALLFVKREVYHCDCLQF